MDEVDDFMNFTCANNESADESSGSESEEGEHNTASGAKCKLDQKGHGDVKEDLLSHGLSFFQRQKKNIRRIAIILGFYFLSVMFYWSIEEWNVLDCFYFTTTTVFAVGFGDLIPTSDASRLFTCFLIIIGLLVVFAELTSFIKGVLMFVKKQTHRILKKEHHHKQGTTGEIDGLINDFHDNHHHIDSNTNSLKITPRARSILKNIGVFFAYILVGAIIFFFNESYSEVSSIYLAIVTVSTVGFGDFRTGQTLHDSTKIMMIFYIPGAFCVLSTCVANILIQYNEILAEQQRIVDCLKPVHYAEIRKRMLASEGGIDKLEFLLIMLASNNSSINFKKDIKPWLDKYDELMEGGDGMEGLQRLEDQEEERLDHVTKALESSQISSPDLRKHLEKSIRRTRGISADAFKLASKDDDDGLSRIDSLKPAAPPQARRFSAMTGAGMGVVDAAAAAAKWGQLNLSVVDESSDVNRKANYESTLGDVELAVPGAISQAHAPAKNRANTMESEPDSHHMTWTDNEAQS